MRLLRQFLTASHWAAAARRVLILLREGLAWGGAIALLEVFGPYSKYDGADLLGLTAAGGMALLLRSLAIKGFLPATRRAGQVVAEWSAKIGRRLSPRHAVVLRPSERTSRLPPDRSRLVPTALLLLLTAGVLAAGPRMLDGGLSVVKEHSYSAYLAGLALLWGILGGTTLLGILASGDTFRRRPRAEEGADAPGRPLLFILLVLWILAAAFVAVVPGMAVLAAVAAIGLVQAVRLGIRPAAGYLLSRRDARGRTRVVPVHAYLRRTHALLLCALLFATALAQGPHLWAARVPSETFLLTHGLGLFASVAALFLAARTGRHFLRLLGAGDMPEIPLTPTLWLRRDPVPTAWTRDATRRGWRVEASPYPPYEGYDLVVGDPSDPRAFRPGEGLGADEARFQLERRFHVVKRRQFWRRFHSLYKEVASVEYETGSGFLFCPHVWLVQGIVRDVDESGEGERPSGTILGQGILGRPYSEAFPGRLRRYVGSVLRTLHIDMVYWEDGVSWADIRAVLGVAFEVYDQGRSPLQERHFIGVPRVRVVIQEDDDSAPGVPPAPDDPPTVHARVLLILKDRGGQEREIAPSPPSNRVPEPSLV